MHPAIDGDHTVDSVSTAQGQQIMSGSKNGAGPRDTVGYLDAREVLADAVNFSARFALGPDAARVVAAHSAALTDRQLGYLVMPSSLACADGSEHRRLRRIALRGMAPEVLERLRPEIAGAAAELVGELESGRPLDIRSVFTEPLVTATLTAVLGVEDRYRTEFREWLRAMTAISRTGTVSAELLAGHAGHAESFTNWLGRRISRLRTCPDGSPLAAMVSEAGDRPVPETDVVRVCHALVVASYAPLTNLLTTLVTTVAADPEMRRKLSVDAAVVPRLAEEVLRCHPPLATTYRTALAPVTLAGERIAPGTHIRIDLAAAGRDETIFPAADEIDPANRTAEHLSFGFGPHSCVGARLARMVAVIAIHSLLDRFDGPHVHEVLRVTEGPGHVSGQLLFTRTGHCRADPRRTH